MKKNIFVIIVAALINSCVADSTIYGKIKPYSTSNKNSFTFSIDEEFLRAHKNSRIDQDYPKMTEAEATLLKRVLIKNDYCLNEDRKPSFAIISRQEKIYDITFSHLIEQNYNAKPVSPRMYFGECK